MMFFSYTVLFDQNYVLNEIITTEKVAIYSNPNSTLRVSSANNLKKTIKMPIYEFVLLGWITCMMIEEVKQVILIAFTRP